MNPVEVDMHTHSIYSDGYISPKDLARKMKYERRLKACVLTDHDVYQGLPEFIEEADKIGLDTLTGIEMTSTYKGTDIHILGYGFSLEQKYHFVDFIHGHWKMYDERTRLILKKYAEVGIMSVTVDELKKIISCPGPYVSENKIREYRVLKGGVSYEDAGEELGRGGFARVGYIKELLMDPVECVKLINEIGGKAVLAHPGEISKRTDGDPEKGLDIFHEILEKLIHANLFGLEAIYSGHTPEENELFADIAKEKRLFITSGSDYHGEYKIKKLNRSISYDDFLKFKEACSR